MNEVLDLPAAAPTAETIVPNLPDLNRRGATLPDLKSLPVWYCSGDYIFQTTEGNYIFESPSDIRRDLRSLGFDVRGAVGGGLSQVEVAMQYIQHRKSVAYVGPLAGKRKGVCIEQGRTVLVTEDFNLPLPRTGGDFPTIRALIEGMLNHGGVTQTDYLYGSLKRSYATLAAGALDRGQAIAFVGPRDCGKTLLQTLITKVLGGRSADPFSWMTGQSAFNSEIFRAENLVFGDKVSASPDIRTRRRFGATIKQIAGDEMHTCHAKHREPVSLRPFWRATFSINDEPENMLVLPPLDESIVDKLHIFKVRRPGLFGTADWSPTRSVNMARLESELPFFLKHLSDFVIPAALEDNRFGILTYQHPDIRVALETMSPETRLQELIDEEYFSEDSVIEIGDLQDKRGTTIEQRLVGPASRVRESARSLLYFPGATGTYLGRLVARGERVSSKTLNGHNLYSVTHPRNPGVRSNRVVIRSEPHPSP